MWRLLCFHTEKPTTLGRSVKMFVKQHNHNKFVSKFSAPTFPERIVAAVMTENIKREMLKRVSSF
jgi:hypothetical protein